MNFSYSGSVALGAEDLNSHQLVSARGDCFEANAVIRLLSFLVGRGTETQWASDSSSGLQRMGRSTGWIGMWNWFWFIVAPYDSVSSVLCCARQFSTNAGLCRFNNFKHSSSALGIILDS